MASAEDQLKKYEAQYDYNGQEVFFRDYSPTGKSKATVLLLHGARFSSLTWTAQLSESMERTGTLEALKAAKIRGVALDLPGFAKNAAIKVTDRAEFLKAFIDHIGDVAVIVSPSASGSFSLPYIQAYGNQIKGFVPVAPVGVSSFDPPRKVKSKLKVLAVAGENDIGGVRDLTKFKELFKAFEQVVIKDGSHPAYLDDPELWNTTLIAFVLKVA